MNEDLRRVLEEILPEVQRPTRYIGGEWNEIVRDHREVELTFALAFPDVYEIGMSHLGFRILYALLNHREDTAAERVFCPWPDMADALRRRRVPLTSLETGTPLARFDVVGFSLQYEMTFTNVLEMLDLGGIPLRSIERTDSDPLVVCGGPVVFNVEPLADFVDLVFVGDGEEMIPEFLERLKRLKRERAPRREILREAARIEGIYVPSLYALERDEHNKILVPVPGEVDAPYPVMRRILMDLDAYPFPDRIVVPHGEIVHDRVSVEIMRGCPVGCRFCQAGYVYRPTRERDPNQVRDTAIRSVRATGYDQFSLTSLNTGEYGAIHPVIFDLMDRFAPEQVSINLSSMHASTITPELAREVRRVRKSGFTIAPEAGTQRLRDVINKNLSEEQIMTACRLAFEAGWEQIKLYFMIGLPTETEADVDGMVDLAQAILAEGRRVAGRRAEVTMSASSFIPKAETPFQWLGMDRVPNLERKQERIAARVRRGVRFKHHRCETSFLEGVFSRGDRALGEVLERAWRGGARFDGWEEHHAERAWADAFEKTGVDPLFYAHTDFDTRGRLPWHVVHSRVNRKWLALELERAMAQGTLSVCGPTDCHGCAPFARDCVKGVVAATTDRPLDHALPVLASSAAPGPGSAWCGAPPPLAPRPTNPVPAVTSPVAPSHRYRCRFDKNGRLRFLGHLDLTRLLMRALRRAGIRLEYSHGFNPKPRVGFSPALSVGVESRAEYLDFESRDRLEVVETLARINDALPRGVRFHALEVIPTEAAALGESIRAARYRARVRGAVGPAIEDALQAFAARAEAVVRCARKGKPQAFDCREELLELHRDGEEHVALMLAVRPDRPSLRPEELLHEIFGEAASGFQLVREELLVEREGHWIDPLAAARPAAVRVAL